jgi:CheY-like chemotaxis protein
MTVSEGRTVGKTETRLLVVENDASSHTGLTALLRAWDQNQRGRWGSPLATARANQPDILLADLVRPGHAET